ncbi:ABC transporter ATP-binding protein [Marinilabiliaceae bacterium JC040]|nr:ABC transporter ATP-binding protein [Marinilabiliaceae bacterium JC040]
MKNVIVLEDLHKIYKESEIEVKAVNGVDLKIQEGEFVAIVGPSGSGKSTLLNMIGGLDEPSSGNVYVDGMSISGMKESELTDFRMKYIGFVFQSYNLLPVLTAKENAEFVMKLQGKSQKECDLRVDSLLKEVGLEERINARPSKLSGGQQQRVAVVRALASKPKFILADEPTANLDSVSTETLLDIMENLNKEENMTFVFSTHDKRVVNKARRIITIEDGKVISDVYK